MNLQLTIESKYREQTAAFVADRRFRALENGDARPADYRLFIANLCRTHLKSPQILAFLYSAAPPAAAADTRRNMLEELGLDEAGVSHPELLLKLAAAAGFDEAARRSLERDAQEELRRKVSDPILFGTLKEVALGVLLETTAFEWMLSQTAGRIADFLAARHGLGRESLEWFHHHAELDVRHAAEGLEAALEFIDYYEFDPAELEILCDVTFRENVFTRRYFRDLGVAETIVARGAK
jgi:pyrroloquinoline quinone (PQQ) biosynthesis protein C